MKRKPKLGWTMPNKPSTKFYGVEMKKDVLLEARLQAERQKLEAEQYSIRNKREKMGKGPSIADEVKLVKCFFGLHNWGNYFFRTGKYKRICLNCFKTEVLE